MTHTIVDALYTWLALPVFPDELVEALPDARARHGDDPLGSLLFDAVDPQKDPQEVAAQARWEAPTGVMSTAAGPDGDTRNDGVRQAAELLVRAELFDRRQDLRNRARVDKGMLPGPAPEVAAVGAELAGLVGAPAPGATPDAASATTAEPARSAELGGLVTVLSAQAAALQAAHAPDPLAPASRRLLRDAVDRMTAGMPRRWISWAYGAFAAAAASAGRADFWLEEIDHLLTLRGGDLPVDLCRAIARQAGVLIARDARWERAERTRRQAEQLLDLHPGDAADLVRVELACAFLHNDDLDERPWTETADDVVTDLVGRLGYPGVNQTLAECGNLLLTTGASPERKMDLLHRWSEQASARNMLDLSVASGTDAVVRDLEEEEKTEQAGQGDGDAGGAVSGAVAPTVAPSSTGPTPAPLPGVPRGVPAGLYDEDFRVRRQALLDQVGGWAFFGILSGDPDEFSAAVAACAEMYTRGIHDPTEVVREESVIFARRLIHGFSRRGHLGEAVRWQRQVLADTTGMTSPRCVRARVQAMWDLTCSTDDSEESARAERDLGVLLENNHADYAVLVRGVLLRRQAARLPAGPPQISLLEQVAALYVQAVELDEWEEHDWPTMIRGVSSDLVDVYRATGDAAGMLTSAERFLEWMESPATAVALHAMSYLVLRHLAAIPETVDAAVSARLDAIRARAERIRAAAPEQVRALADAFDVLEGETDLWRADHARPLGQADAAAAAAVRIIDDVAADGSGGGEVVEIDAASLEFLGLEGRYLIGDTISTGDGLAATCGALVYLRHGLYRFDPEADGTLGLMVAFAADPAGFHGCRDHGLVRELYALLEPLVDEARDGVQVPAFRRMAKNAARRGKGLFRR